MNILQDDRFFHVSIPIIAPVANGMIGRNRYEIVKVKDKIKQLTKRAIFEQEVIHQYQGEVFLIYLRKGRRLVDMDGLPISAKYFVDTLVKMNVIKEDNPKVCKQLFFQQIVGANDVGTELLVGRKEELKELTPRIEEWKINGLLG